MCEPIKIIIVGGGVSGLACAQHLLKFQLEYPDGPKIDVVVLEGSHKIGGRVYPISVPINLIDDSSSCDDNNNIIVDGGASWIHGLDKFNAIYQLSQKHKINLLVTSSDDDPKSSDCQLYDVYNNTNISSENFDKIVELWESVKEKLMSYESNEFKNYSVRKAVDEIIVDLGIPDSDKNILEWFLQRIEISQGAELSKSLLQSWIKSPADGEYEEALVMNGLGQFLLPILSKDLNILLNCRVKEIRNGVNDSKSIEIITRKDEIYDADFIILSCSPMVLKKESILEKICIPQTLQSAISRYEIGLMDIVVLRFKRIFWDMNKTFFGVVNNIEENQVVNGNNKIFSTFLNLSKARDDSSALLSAQVYGDSARIIEKLGMKEISNLACKVLSQIFKDEFEEPIGCIVHKWGSDESVGGSWSLAGMNSSLDDFDEFAKPVCDCFGTNSCLQLCGEATNRRFYGTVHGAYQSGIRSAEHLIKQHILQEKDNN